MYSDTSAWTNKDGTRRYKWKYQCGHYAKSKFGQCKKNAISAEWIEAEVIEYTKLLVRNQQFAEDIQSQIGQKVDVSEIDIEIGEFRKDTLDFILENEKIFGVNLKKIGMAETISNYFGEMIQGKGAVRRTLEKYIIE